MINNNINISKLNSHIGIESLINKLYFLSIGVLSCFLCLCSFFSFIFSYIYENDDEKIIMFVKCGIVITFIGFTGNLFIKSTCYTETVKILNNNNIENVNWYHIKIPFLKKINHIMFFVGYASIISAKYEKISKEIVNIFCIYSCILTCITFLTIFNIKNNQYIDYIKTFVTNTYMIKLIKFLNELILHDLFESVLFLIIQYIYHLKNMSKIYFKFFVLFAIFISTFTKIYKLVSKYEQKFDYIEKSLEVSFNVLIFMLDIIIY